MKLRSRLDTFLGQISVFPYFAKQVAECLRMDVSIAFGGERAELRLNFFGIGRL
jgi:hypothetical protein